MLYVVFFFFNDANIFTKNFKKKNVPVIINLKQFLIMYKQQFTPIIASRKYLALINEKQSRK